MRLKKLFALGMDDVRTTWKAHAKDLSASFNERNLAKNMKFLGPHF